MKLKLAQKVTIAFYSTKIKSIALVSPKKAAEVAFTIFCTPFNGKPEREVPPLFKQAEQLELVVENTIVRGWRWQPKNGNRKSIAIAHGFDSYSYKFETYITSLTKLGFTVIVFDAPGHGTSDGKTLHSLLYKKMLVAINNKFGSLYAIIGHSIGGLAASLAAEEMPDLQKLVIIAPSIEVTRPIRNFIQLFDISPEVQAEFDALIFTISKLPITYFDVSRVMQNITTATFWLHDETDKICPIEDVLPIKEKILPHIDFLITNGLGHSKIYKEQSSIDAIVSFLLT